VNVCGRWRKGRTDQGAGTGGGLNIMWLMNGRNCKRRLSVCYLNNEWIGYVLKLRRRGEFTSQMGFGIVELMARRIRIAWRLPKKQREVAARWHSSRFGNVFQQWHALRLMSKYDAVFAANTDSIGTLAMLRGIGVFPKPIIALLHTPLVSSTVQGQFRSKLVLAGVDRLLCMAPSLLKHMREEFPEFASKMADSRIGPDLPMCPERGECRDFFVASGKTGRDYQLLARAFQGLPYRCRVYPVSSGLDEKLPPNVELVVGNTQYRDLLNDLSRATALIIPIRKEYCAFGTSGFSSLWDALGVGIPCIVAKSPWFLDVEKEGVGLWYEPSNVDSLRGAITRLATDRMLRAEMGDRARRLSETRNMNMLGDVILGSLREVSGCADRESLW